MAIEAIAAARTPRERQILILRYWGWALLITTTLLILYLTHPYYLETLNAGPLRAFGVPFSGVGVVLSGTEQALVALYIGYLAVILSAPFRGDVSSSKTLLVGALFESIPGRVRRHMWGRQPAYAGMFAIDAETRTALLSVAVKAFFLPMMTNFAIANGNALLATGQRWPLPAGAPPLDLANFALDCLYQTLFLVDTVVFVFGYAVEAVSCRNRIRSVEPTLLGWAVALVCYPPLLDVSNKLLPSGGQTALIWHPGVLLVFRLVAVSLYLVYAWASVALGPRASNLTNRGTVSWGPYRWVRHPAYICKNIAWWFERLPAMTLPVHVLSMLLWNLIYLVRALTEERHLAADPEYVAYCEKVRYRFIPGVF